MRRVAQFLRTESAGGILLLMAAAVALVFANSPLRDAYHDVRDFRFGPAGWHLDLTVQAWAADGLLAVFFLVAGVELKREMVLGQLRDRAEAVLPVLAAIAGMAVPAGIYVLVNLIGNGPLDGWAIPVATDIAFALAVLAVIGSHLPTALRAFLLSLAVIDDLLAIVLIAIVFTDDLDLAALGGAALILAAYGYLQHRRIRAWWLYVPMGVTAWALMHESGVHATVAGVAIGALTRVRPDDGERETPADRVDRFLHPVSAGVCVPLFAFTAAGVSLSADALGALFTEPVAIGVAAGLVLGKTSGVFGATYLTVRFTAARLSSALTWADVFGLSILCGMGFTVALLIGDLSFPDDEPTVELVKAAVLLGSVVAAVCAAVVLRLRDRAYRRIAGMGTMEPRRNAQQDTRAQRDGEARNDSTVTDRS